MVFMFDEINYRTYDPWICPEVELTMSILPDNSSDLTSIRQACNSRERMTLDDIKEILGIVSPSEHFTNPHNTLPAIKNVYFNDPVTVVLWDDGTKTIVRCQKGDTYSKEVGLALCISKKALGNKPNFNDIFKKWIPEKERPETIKEPTKAKAEMPTTCVSCKHGDRDWTEGPCNVCMSGDRWGSKIVVVPVGCATCKFEGRELYYPPCRDCDNLHNNWAPKE